MNRKMSKRNRIYGNNDKETGRIFAPEKRNTDMEKKNPLKTRNLGGMEVSALGFGCMNFVCAYGHVMRKEEAIPVIRHAYEQGVTLFDTAEISTALSPLRNSSAKPWMI